MIHEGIEMEASESAARFLAVFINTLKSERHEWEKRYQPEKMNLKRDKSLAEQALKHELEELETRFRSRLQNIKMEEARRTQNFQQFLLSLDSIKSQVIKRYSQMPEPLALLIYQRATDLLTAAWHNPDELQRLSSHRKFIELTTTLTIEMAQAIDSNGNTKLLPERTIDLITRDV
jgi:hypothetical protein